MASESSSSAAMVILIVSLVVVVGIFAYFMANSGQQSTVKQTPAPTIEAPTLSMPEPAKAPAL